jgi:hypothetical protein
MRGTIAGACLLLVTAPFLAVRYPPITDLPQHVAQVRLLAEALTEPASPYVVQWFTPYWLGYILPGLAWLLLGADHAARAAMIGLAWVSVGATHLLAWRRGRSQATAALATVFFFSHVVYWGFLPFAAGWPVFVLWLLLTTRSDVTRGRRSDIVVYLAVALLLYCAHVLWLVAGLVWLLLSGAAFRVPPRVLGARLLGVVPVAALAVAWFPLLAARRFRSPTIWGPWPPSRLEPAWLADAALGGLTGLLEPITLLVILAWLTLGLLQHGRSAWGATDRGCLLAGALLLLLALGLPVKHTNTIRFAQRWMPFAATLLVLAAPSPRLGQTTQRLAALGLLTAYCATTATVWSTFERVSLSGLTQSLEALPSAPRVLGLDFVRSSPFLRTSPFLQTFAYAQVLRGGHLNFSFADAAPSPVVFREPARAGWTVGLEWFPEWIEASDFRHFDHALVNAPERIHDELVARFWLVPLTQGGLWRLYRVRR